MNSHFSPLTKGALRVGRALHRRLSGLDDAKFAGETCPACGHDAPLVMRGVLWPELVLQWELGPAWANWMDQREGLRCAHCHANLRSRHLAQCIVNSMNAQLGTQTQTLPELCAHPRMRELKVAEINAAGDLHPTLRALPHLHYSEYGSTAADIPSEDLLNLSYPDASFDLAITSDVLEHVPDAVRALSEIARILKPGGLHVFSVPVVWSQPRSRQRAEIREGQLVHHLPPSHHGAEDARQGDFLVCHEFGRDFVTTCGQAGFKVQLVPDKRNPSLVTFVATRADSPR